ncbi:DUF1294 domain-containing protein [Aurantimonas sp. VKM B-3413]|uniref:DUF1294 domain-containing protein n=1 Tax=Aurantimonas sp. VKM B-3413 TaxID=2779401 RepID=UPI001E32CB63|nr:DUF1294 domain-containing protein [Aurantimonas sp. VKM B-3413]MCB8838470.1 DUF1294 domain-containing protein [Aurantimonas sp. VKM B-3413]
MALGIGLFLVAINCAAFLAFVSDKAKAWAGRRRIPEATLLRLALFGGTLGAIGAQRLIRHKTQKEPFRSRLLLIAGMQLIVLVCLAIVLVTLGKEPIRQAVDWLIN